MRSTWTRRLLGLEAAFAFFLAFAATSGLRAQGFTLDSEIALLYFRTDGGPCGISTFAASADCSAMRVSRISGIKQRVYLEKRTAPPSVSFRLWSRYCRHSPSRGALSSSLIGRRGGPRTNCHARTSSGRRMVILVHLLSLARFLLALGCGFPVTVIVFNAHMISEVVDWWRRWMRFGYVCSSNWARMERGAW